MTENARPRIELVKSENLNLDGLQDFFNPPRLSKPEMHLLLKPFFVLDRHADRFKPIEYIYSVIEHGKGIVRSWTVQPHFKYGLPGPFDRDVCIILHEIVHENYLSKNQSVPSIMPIGSLTDFLRRMRLSAESGKNIAALKESLNRLKNTLIDAQETFFNNKKKCYVSLRVTLLKGVIFAGEDDGQGGKYEQNFVLFDETILSNLNSGYVMIVDVEMFRRFKSNIAKQLYAHLAYRFHLVSQDGLDRWVTDYQWLATHVGIKTLTELRRAKDQLKEAHDELKKFGYIADYCWDGWRILYTPGSVWKGEQLRRKSGHKRHQTNRVSEFDLQPVTDSPTGLEERDGVLARQAARILIGRKPDEATLSAHGLTIEDAHRKAASLKTPEPATLD